MTKGSSWYGEDARRIFAPPKDKILTSMEELIQNFMLVTEGPQIPEGEVYFEAENPKGSLGFYIVSKGGGVPYRLKIHYYSRGPMGYGMGRLQIVQHDGKGRLSFQHRPFVVMQDGAYVDLGRVKKPL